MVSGSAGIIDIPGVMIGHATDREARTGCSVIVFEHPTLTAVEVRGAAPGTRELDLLAPGRMVQRADAILLTGGSAFGLSCADGVVRALAAAGRGFPTPAGPVPIVPAAVIFDLAEGSAKAPDQAFGEAAVKGRVHLSRVEQGKVGAGTGATSAKILGRPVPGPGGFGISQVAVGENTVTAIAVVNAFGVVRASVDDAGDPRSDFLGDIRNHHDSAPGQATTLVSVITTVPCTHDALLRCCIAAHDGIARMIVPSHTLVDGDVAFASGVNEATITLGALMNLTISTELAVESAISHAIRADTAREAPMTRHR